MFVGFPKKIYKESKAGLSKYVPWAFMADCEGCTGVVIQKGGCMQKSYAFRGPDLDAASSAAVASISIQLNDALKRFGSGWAVYTEIQSYMTAEYPGAAFTNRAAFLVDAERKATYSAYGKHHAKSFYLTFVWEPPADAIRKARSVFYREGNGEEKSIVEDVRKFSAVCDDVAGILSAKIDIQSLDDEETLSYLHSALSLEWHRVRKPTRMMFLDRLLVDAEVHMGRGLRVGEYYCPIITINDFPMETYPGILDALNRADIEYRWVSRFICLDKEDALKAIEGYQKKYYGSRRNWKQFASEAMTKEVTDTRVNQGALSMEADANEAQVECVNDVVGWGYYTSCLQVWDTDAAAAEEKASFARKLIQASGFTCISESLNAFRAWQGMMPGHVYANIRRPLVSTGNMAHVVPTTAVWTGMKSNSFLEEVCGVQVPLLTCSTNFSTPFFLNLHVGDVGHTFIAGPTGAGKSTLLGLLMVQWLKYPRARVILFDKDRSSRQLTYAVGGSYYEPVSESVEFQPLRRLERVEDLIWASEFVELLLSLQNIPTDAQKSAAIIEALKIMKSIEAQRRTLSSFHQYVQDEQVKIGVQPYTLEGPYGSIFDASASSLVDDFWIMIEMGPLMQLGDKAIMPALMYLFHEIEELFDGRPTQLVLDEAWLFLRHEAFKRQQQNWLKTTRKKNVACIYATQEIADAARSDIASTILQQCHTKIYLPDEEASTPSSQEMYRSFGLSDAEIDLVARSQKKRDYFYKSSLGTRLFRLDMGPIQLGLLTGQNHEFLDQLAQQEEADILYEILEHKIAHDGQSLLEKANAIFREDLCTREQA
jgi:type IV secretion/conjugal transfer VirB4 family ATPase